MKMKSYWMVASLVCGFLSSGPHSYATATLRLSDGTTTKIISDGSADDSVSAPGTVSYIGGVGNFTFRITTGVTHPSIGSPTNPMLTLNEVTVLSGSGTLTIDFSEQGFGPIGQTPVLASIGGSTNSTVSYSTYSGAGLFDLSHLITQQGPFVGSAAGSSFGGALSGGDATGTLAAQGNFSLTEHVVISNLTGADRTGFTATLMATPSVPDGGSSVALLGCALVGVCLIRSTVSRLRA